MSFADGFTQGFGLIQNAKNSARENELRQQQLDDANKYRMDSLQLEREQNAFSRGIQQQELNELIRQGEVADAEAAAAAEERRKREERAAQAEADNREIKAAQLEAAAASKRVSDAKFDESQNQIRQTNAAKALDVFMRDIQRLERGEISWQDINTDNLIEATKGTTFDMATMLDPSVYSTGAELMKAINAGQLPSEEIVLQAMNQFIGATGIGDVVDDTYQNAPEWMRNGQYRIVDKKFVSLSTGTDFVRDENGGVAKNEDGSDATKNVLFGDVRVTVEGPGGELFYYTAPATDYRSQDSSKHTAIDIDELTKGYAGFMNMANYVRKNQSLIESTLIERFNKTGDYATKKAEVEDRYEALDQERGNEASFIPGMTYSQLFNNKPLLEEVVKQEVLFEGSRRNREDLGYDRMLSTVRTAPEVQEMERELNNFGMPPLTNRQLEELAGYFDVMPNGRLRADEKALRKFRITIGIRAKQTEKSRNTRNPGR